VPYMQSRGDYLGGGYQRGDFLGIGGFIKRAATSVFKASPVGQIVGAISGPGPSISRMQERLPPPGSIGGPAGMQQMPQKVPGMKGAAQRAIPGGQTGYTCEGAPRGKHLNKSGYYTQDGYVAPGTKYVTNRTMNVGNARALRRSIRREQGFVKLAQRSLKGTGYKIARR
jgi:hypothetical protein